MSDLTSGIIIGGSLVGTAVYLFMSWYNKKLYAAVFYNFMFFLTSKNYVEDMPDFIAGLDPLEKKIFKDFLVKFRKDNPEIEQFIEK